MTIETANAPAAENIKRIIKQKGLIKMTVAERAGLSRQQFSDMLSGRKIIKPCDLSRISAALGVDISELFAERRPNA